MRHEVDLGQFRVEPGTAVRLSEHDTAWMGPTMQDLGEDELKDEARAYVAECIEDFADVQELLYADNRYSVLLIFQGMDASGKDSTIKHVTAGVNPAARRGRPARKTRRRRCGFRRRPIPRADAKCRRRSPARRIPASGG